MTILMSLSVQFQLSKIPGEELKPLHRILFGRPGNVSIPYPVLQYLVVPTICPSVQPFTNCEVLLSNSKASEVKRNIRLFNGFDIEKVCPLTKKCSNQVI